MKNKTKKILIPFILMIIFNLSFYSIFNENFGAGITPHMGILFISGLLFGPYGALGAAIGNLLCDIFRGYSLGMAIASDTISFAISLLAYKLWYKNFKGRYEVTKPTLNNTTDIILFIMIILISSLLFAVTHQKLLLIFFPSISNITYDLGLRYWLNYLNSSFILGIIGIWISKRICFVHVPKKSKRPKNKKLYTTIGCLLVISAIIIAITDYFFDFNLYIHIGELLLIVILLFAYLTKPNTRKVRRTYPHSASEKIMNILLIIALIILILGYIISGDADITNSVMHYFPIETYEIATSIMLFSDLVMALFLIPSLAVMKYTERKVIEPIIKFSQIDGTIKRGYKIGSEELLKTYAEYAHEENEIGNLARSYTKLIKYNNNYIENIKEIESEREKMQIELNIAEGIQRAALPTKVIENEDFLAYGYSKPAKEVGGDFFDYFVLDEEYIALVIGDASGKGISAALPSVMTQNLIKHLATETRTPSKILKSLNDQFTKYNPETMFISLWLGMYNTKTNKAIFSNAGHNPPLIKENGKFRKLDVNPGIVLGLLEDFEYEDDEIDISEGLVLYTDGITDANNSDRELYGEDRLIKLFNKLESDENLIDNLLDDINEFAGDEEQFDDMTIMVLVNKRNQ